jgi:phage FluMu protein Com
VPKPVPEREARDARGYQLEQLRRRYSPKETTLSNGAVSLLFNLTPSDPDFPFDLDHLECDVHVPAAYPKKPPQLHVKNTDIPRGFAINIEKGWDRLVQEKRGATLLALTNALDRNLESLLSEQKADTVKLTIFKDTRHLEAQPVGESAKEPVRPQVQPPVVHRPYVPEESYSKDQIAEAKARRAQEVRQLEARMSRLPGYQKSSDGIIYTLPLEPKRRANLPAGLQPVQSVQLIIPLLYPLQSLRILLNDVESEDAEPVEELFSLKAAEQKQMTLTSHVNYLAQNLHLLAKQAEKPSTIIPAAPETPAGPDQEAKEAEHSSTLDEGKGHIHVIPRPPEWMHGAADGSDSSEEDSYDEDDEDDGGAAIEPNHADGPSLPTQTVERGTAMSFPSIELHGIELLQVSVLNLNVKCDRCKTLNEITGLKDNLEKPSSCKKCATAFTVRFRQELIHQNSTRAGFIDATGCTVADLLPRYPLRLFPPFSVPSQLTIAQHLHANLLQLLHPVRNRLPLRPRRHHHKRLPLLPRALHLLPARRQILVLRARRPRRPAPDHGSAQKAGETRPARGRAASQPRRVRALSEELPLVSFFVLCAGVSV